MTELTKLTELDAAYDLAGRVIGCAMTVHRTLGPGFLESVYRNALAHELTKTEMIVQLEQPLRVRYEGIIVGDFIADMIVDSILVVELKAVQALAKAHEVQLVNYLNATQTEEGLLLNFGGESLEFRKKFKKSKFNSVNFVNSVDKQLI